MSFELKKLELNIHKSIQNLEFKIQNLKKMYKEALRSIEGIQIYPIISLAIFGLFFIGLLVWVMTADKKYIEEMSNLPMQ